MPERPDARERPPEALRTLYKQWQKATLSELETTLVDGNNGDSFHLTEQDKLFPETIDMTFEDFTGEADSRYSTEAPRVYSVKSVPEHVQMSLLDKLLHRDLSNPDHKTNVHLHYDVSYPSDTASIFDVSSQSLQHNPKAGHALMSTQKMLDKKLRWMTLGGQYDWTNKVYPVGPPPPFPKDIKDLLEGIFPIKAEAAIVNLYSPGDTLSVHRDVSEECAQPLVSISIGCDALFVIGFEAKQVPGDPLRSAVLRLRSGDAVLMSGASRYAWHGVPKVLAGTCPDWLRDWPTVGGEENPKRFEGYKGWMEGKRVNLNARQMFAQADESQRARDRHDHGMPSV
ncbi:hypothetical protein LTR78_001856 [Recurvomyces mirabilis]|uniref:mRNA N(6)-methyladenine demethylase n=1 Tax=Recurvomyces mirabilis TaxID=574656 RepID=A0AAE1C577_9PEZI|nr:hypothetical protein LTR78_001856 [Recurvomyces mirabilis]